MAVEAARLDADATTVQARRPGTLDFVRLKLRLMRNGFRGQGWRLIAFVSGLVWGLAAAALALVGLAATGRFAADLGYVVAAFAGAAVLLGWTLVPLLFFGVDETLDPARFALLPVPPATLARGMLAAAFVGVPALATLVTTSGLVIAAWLRFGPVEAGVALGGVVTGLTLCLIASRAVTSAFAALLRSRRMRDLAAVIIALLASSLGGPVQWVVGSVVSRGSLDEAVRVAKLLAWTPLGAAYVVPYDAAAGRWDLVAARFAITAGAVVLLLWWWARTLESAMLATSGDGPARVPKGGVRSAVPALIAGPARTLARPGPFGAVFAREARFWWRDGRRRAGMVSILVASAVLPVALNFSGRGSAMPSGFAAGAFGAAVTMAGTMGGMMLGNQFGYDGTAYATHLLIGVRGEVELRARAAAVALVALPLQAAVVIAVCLLAGEPAQLPTGLGVLAASFGCAVAAAGLLSVLAPYPLPDNTNPFAVNSGRGTAKGLLAIVAMLATIVLAMPVTVLAFLFSSGWAGWRWLVFAGGIGYGIAVARLGTFIAGDLLDRRGPEILASVSPRR